MLFKDLGRVENTHTEGGKKDKGTGMGKTWAGRWGRARGSPGRVVSGAEGGVRLGQCKAEATAHLRQDYCSQTAEGEA